MHIKPKLSCVHGLWLCCGSGVNVFAPTFAEAYIKWAVEWAGLAGIDCYLRNASLPRARA